jgi:hypothetical protein
LDEDRPTEGVQVVAAGRDVARRGGGELTVTGPAGARRDPPAFGLDPDCEALLAELRARREGMRTGPAPGELGEPARLTERQLLCLTRAELAAGGLAGGCFVWQDLDSELAVNVMETRLALLDGILLFGLPTRCEELHEAELVIPFAIGTPVEPAGMVMAAEPLARGPELLVELWGRAAVATVWRAFVDACALVAASAGEDRFCNPLLPGAVYAEPGMLTIVPQARHAVDLGARP